MVRPTRGASVRAARLRGEPRLPGDKSVSHRALLLALLAEGESRISGAGDGLDVRATAAVAAALGATVERTGDDPRAVDYVVVSPGRAGLREPGGILDCRNSGTTFRLVAGIVAGLPLFAVLDGDDSLRQAADGASRRAARRDGRHDRRTRRRDAASARDRAGGHDSPPSTTPRRSRRPR